MTLLLAMIKPEGIYMSIDYRVTHVTTGALIDDASIKFLSVTYPPEGGPRALFGYTGLARLPDGTAMGAWIRETIRGESEVINVSMAHLRTRLDRDIAPFGVGLMVNVFVQEKTGRQLWGGFSNIRRDFKVSRSFEYVMNEVSQASWFANGSGSWALARDRRATEILNKQINVRPRRHEDHMKLLAAMNRRVAARATAVSPFCHVTFLPSQGEGGAKLNVFVEKGETVPFEMPHVLFGIDTTGMSRRTHESFTAMMRGEPSAPSMDVDAMNEELKRRP